MQPDRCWLQCLGEVAEGPVALTEFGLIERFFAGRGLINPCSTLGIGDDCALLRVPDDRELAVTTDTMVENVHFFPGADPGWLGHKLLAVNLSDLAGMGAQPVAATLALTLPAVDTAWLEPFSSGFMQLARKFSLDLIGGDTTSGPLVLTVQAMGLVPAGAVLRRATARTGDLIYVTGELGDAGLGLKVCQGFASDDPADALRRLHRPEPRIAAGLALRNIASACIDISDGLASDLGHILRTSGVGASIDWDRLPFSPAVTDYIARTGDWQMPLTAGDDYELCFTIPPEQEAMLAARLQDLHCSCRQIGSIEASPGLRLRKAGREVPLKGRGYEHFTAAR